METTMQRELRKDRENRTGISLVRIALWIMAVLLAAALVGTVLPAQPASVSFQSGVPNPVTNVGAVYSGAGGSQAIYYYVIARFAAGSGQPSVVGVALNTQGSQNLSASNTVTVTWTGVSGATGYDVVRSDTQGFPATPCACAVILNTTGLSALDTGAALSTYPAQGVPTIQPVLATLSVDNVSQTIPYINVQLVNNSLRMALSPKSWTAGNCVQIAADGNLSDAGAACNSAGAGTVTTGSVLTAGLPVIGAGASAIGIGTRQGNTTKYVSMGAGSPSTNDCAKFDANGNIVSNGAACAAGVGDVVGPASATNNAITLFDGTTGKLLKDSAVGLPTGNLVGTGQSNTWSTGTQDMTAATAFLVKTANGYAPTVAGSIGVNTTNNRLVFAANGATQTVAQLGAGTPSTNDCAKFDASGNLVTNGAACAGASVAPVASSTYAGRGTCTGANAGQMAIYSDSLLVSFCISSAWIDTFANRRVTVPSIAGTWVNQGTSTLTNTGGNAVLNVQAGAGGDNHRFMVFSLPVTPFTVTLQFALSGFMAGYDSCSLYLRQSSDGKLINFTHAAREGGSGQIFGYGVQKYTNPTTFSANYVGPLYAQPISPPNTLASLRISDDGVTRTYQISADGLNWQTVTTNGHADFLTADQYGYGCNGNGVDALTGLFYSLTVQ
jgi:hypothetical protein